MRKQGIIKRILCIALTLCMCIGGLTLPAFSEEAADAAPAKITIYVLASDVPQYTKLTADMFTTREISSVNAPKNIMESLDGVVDKFAATNLYAGDYIYLDKVVNRIPSNAVEDALKEAGVSYLNYIYVTDYVEPNSGKDVADIIQKLIVSNPNKTIFFPDGEYIISKPIMTSAKEEMSVAIRLSDGARIKATKDWNHEESMICLGTLERGDSIVKNGSYYGIRGGTIDGNGVADGIMVGPMDWKSGDQRWGGRESLIYNINVVNTRRGVSIYKGGNNVSSDIDVDDLTIVGNGTPESVGIYMPGYDNSITNVKIYDCQVGVQIDGGGNLMRNIQVINTCKDGTTLDTDKMIGIYDKNSGGFMLHCYVENYTVAYKINGASTAIEDCNAAWTDSSFKLCVFFDVTSTLRTILSCCRAEFYDKKSTNLYFRGSFSSVGKIECPIFNSSLVSEYNIEEIGKYTVNGSIDIYR